MCIAIEHLFYDNYSRSAAKLLLLKEKNHSTSNSSQVGLVMLLTA